MNRLDDLNRTERYFTSTLFGSLLLYEDLQGTRKFLNWLGAKKKITLTPIHTDSKKINWQSSEKLPDHVEVVTELNIKREIGHYGETLNEIELSELSAKQNVPDVIIIYGEILIVIEGKFFVKGQSRAFIDNQLLLQKEEIQIMIDYLKPLIKYSSHIYLGPETDMHLKNCDLCITWKDIQKFSSILVGEKHYITERLKLANRRYSKFNASKESDRINYNAKCDFNEIIKLCKQEGNNVRIGYHGGEHALIQSNLSELQYRKFKWDYTNNPIGKKNLKNWLPGNLFLMRIEEVMKNKKNRSLNQSTSKQVRKKNYADKTDFDGIISLCAKHGYNLLIGFSGGKNALINASKTKLQTRRYKYDFRENNIGKKNRRNWLSGDEFIRLLKEYFDE